MFGERLAAVVCGIDAGVVFDAYVGIVDVVLDSRGGKQRTVFA